MTDRTLREKIEWLVEKAPSSDEDKGWNEAVTEVLRILDAHTAAQPAPVQRCAECDCKHGGRCCTWIKSNGPCEQCHPQPAPDAVAEAGSDPCIICGSPHVTRGEMTLPDGRWVCSRPCELAAEAVRKAKDATEFRNLAKGTRP